MEELETAATPEAVDRLPAIRRPWVLPVIVEESLIKHSTRTKGCTAVEVHFPTSTSASPAPHS